MAKPPAEQLLFGLWHIVWMSNWDEDYFNEEVQAFLKIEETGQSEFQFGYVQGQMDCRITTDPESSSVKFTWEGIDAADGTPCSGRGWAVVKKGELRGKIFFHLGDDSKFLARRPASKTAQKKK